MNKKIIEKLKLVSREKQTKDDPSHDFSHIMRVLNMAMKIGKSVKADMDVVIPAALFHDIIVYRKDTPQSRNETEESAIFAGELLGSINEYPKHKIEIVQKCIRECSFTKGIIPDVLESKVLQDADLLESTGAISIIRTFSSGGQMNRPFYNHDKPLNYKHENDYPSGVGLFYRRLLIVQDRMHTKLAKSIAKKRTAFLKKFLEQLKSELQESGILK